MLSLGELRALPKVTLHDHLDSGLRLVAVVEHCAENGHELPTTNPEKPGQWLFESTDSGSLVRYLEGFVHTTTAVQIRDQLAWAVREFVLDQAAGGVVCAEVRQALEQHLEKGLAPEAMVEAVYDSLVESMAQAKAAEQATVATQTVTTMRHVDEPATDIAELALTYRDGSVVGYDTTGAEVGFRPTRFRTFFDLLRHNDACFTIHAGEADGSRSMQEAAQLCGTQRIDRDVHVCEDIGDFWRGQPGPGRFAVFVRDQQIPLEVYPTSDLQTGVVKFLDRHLVGRLAELGFNVIIHCDNRLMSGTSPSEESTKLSETFGQGFAEVEAMTMAAMHTAFLHHDERKALVGGLIRPAFHAVRRRTQA